MKTYINIPYSKLKIKKINKYTDCDMCGICLYNNKLYSFYIVDDYHNGDVHSLDEKHANLNRLNFISCFFYNISTKIHKLIHLL